VCPDEDLLVAMIERALPASAFAELEHHLDSCDRCREVVAAAAGNATWAVGTPVPLTDDAPALEGTIDERYAIVRLIGRGGMGSVYLARDLTLDREVALKIHRTGSGGDRLHLEAIAMAKLAHPNVVTVFEVTSVDDRLCVAMEYVRGHTLRDWLAAEPQRWREIVALLEEAGRGLAAAHAAELVHRDFKPENVLVGDDGRARVTDFGLVQLRGERVPALPDAPIGELTETGAIVGTPAYMAPEQLDGGIVDERSDQFAFGVVAWECLFGRRPFAGSSVVALRVAIENQELVVPSTKVPDRVRRVLERTLAAKPEQRYPDMPAVIAALRRAAAPRLHRRITFFLGALVAAVAAAGWLATTGAGRADDGEAACERSADRIDAVWNPVRAAQLRTAFVATRAPFGADSADRVVEVVDRFRDRFTAETVDACRASFVRHEASHKALDLRSECLDHGLRRVDELVGLLVHADRSIVEKAVNAAHATSSLETCRDVPLMLARQDPPTDPRIQSRIGELDAKLARAEALVEAGDAKASLAVASEVAAEASSIEYHPLRARAAYDMGVAQLISGSAEAEASLERGATAAEAGRDDQLAVLAWTRLMSASITAARYDEAVRRAELARAKLERIGNPPHETAFFLLNRGRLAQKRNDFTAARADLERAYGLDEIGGAERPLVVNILALLAQVYHDLGERDLERSTAERAAALAEKLRGPLHPLTADALVQLGLAQGTAGHHRDAIGTLGRALAIRARVYGADSDLVAAVLNNQAGEYRALGELGAVEKNLTAALEIKIRRWGPDHPRLLPVEMNLGALLIEVRPRDAVGHLEHALAIAQKDHGPDDVTVAKILAHLGYVHNELGNHALAKTLLSRALAIDSAKLGPIHPAVAMIWAYLANVHLAERDDRAAIDALEHAVAIDDRGQREPSDAAQERFELAKALWRTNRDRRRAVVLATAARDGLTGTDHTAQRAEIESWLRGHHS
jgi:tetratricopeptide (TPR) repeat protein/predicted Ser/Thr protein kinase